MQLRLYRLDLTYSELQRFKGNFGKVRDEIEASYQEVLHLLKETKEKYIAQIDKLAELYECQISELKPETYNNAWKDKPFVPSDPFARVIWDYKPGKNAVFDLQYQIDMKTELLEKLCQVSWKMPFPGFSPYPKDVFPLKLKQDSGNTDYLLVQPHHTISEVKAMARRKIASLPEEFYLKVESRILRNDENMANFDPLTGINLQVISKIDIYVLTASWQSIHIIVDLNSTVKELLTRLERDKNRLLFSEFLLLYEQKVLKETFSLANCGLFNGSTVRMMQKVLIPFSFKVHFPENRTQTITVESSGMLVSTLKQLINTHHRLSSKHYSLTYMGEELNDHMNLAYYSIREDSCLLVVSTGENTINIVIEQNKQAEIPLNVSKWDTVETVMRKITEKSASITLNCFKGETLANTRFLVSYNVENQSVLQGYEMTISVRVLDGKIIPVNANKGDDMTAIRGQIQRKEAIPPDKYHLIFENRLLEDEETVTSCGILNTSTIYLAFKWFRRWTIHVKTDTGKTITVETENPDFIEGIKAEIQGKEGIPPDQQYFLYNGKPLVSTKTLLDYKILHELTIYMRKLRVGPREILTLSVKTITGKSLTLNADNCEYIDQIKAKIEEKTGIPAGQQHLLYNSKGLEDCKTLADYNVPNKASLHLLLRKRGEMQISVKSLTGKTIILSTTNEAFLENIKALVQDQEGIPPNQQCLIYNNELLREDGRTLEEYNITHSSLLHLRVQTPGSIVTVHFQGGKQYTPQIDCYSDLVSTLKTKIGEITTISPAIQQLFIDECELEDGRSLQSYDISSVVKMSLKC